jgi:cyclic beta-1,2-glucan synthetase
MELCSPTHLGELARELAENAAVGRHRPGQPLLRRLRENARILRAAHQEVAAAARRQEALTPDAEWLLDNFHIIEEVLRQVHNDLPRGYYAELPVLDHGTLAGLPRIYAFAMALVVHTDSTLDEGQILDFVKSYQSMAPLTIGELWAVPIMLRVALLENLRRLAYQLLEARNDRARAIAWAERATGRPSPLPPQPRDAFLVALLQALRDHAPAGPHAEGLHEWLMAHGADTTEALRREHRRQAANQVSIGNCVTSLRLLGALDWNAFFEKSSVVEEVLRSEPTGVYARQDFLTRDRQRRAVEQLARGARRSEVEVARRAVARCQEALDAETADRAVARAQIGWHLIGAGRPAFDAELGYRPRLKDRRIGFVLGHPHLIFFGLLSVLSIGMVAGVLALAAPASWAMWLLIALLVVLPASEAAVALTNYLVSRLVPPRLLPRLSFSEGIPHDCTSFVVIPSMLIRQESAAQLLERLELHYLANPDPQLYFALLADFADAPRQHMPEDERYIQAALEGVRRLNQRYAPDGPARFFLFHRHRQWNEAQGCWMGWERKRGKLDEFNRLLRGATDTSYSTRSGDVSSLPRIRYVLTLDADTVLLRDAARRLVSILAHPLNRAVRSADGRRIESGYAILQPRVSFLYQAGLRSWFSRIFAGSAGIDPYSSAASDTYQDLFGKGTFTGKGLYDLDAFESTAGRAFPDNRILSHDLIESTFARCALVTNIEVFDDFPSRYHTYARREHRWVRGDWQLLPWLGPTVLTPEGRRPNVLPTLERWKVIDNLRRSLMPPALIVLLILGWTVLPGQAWAWTLAALLVPLLPLLLQLFERGRDVMAGVPGRALLAQAPFSVGNTAGQSALAIIFLADQSRLLLDAIARTLWRVLASHRHMLEWETAAAAEARLGDGLRYFAHTMWPTIVMTLFFAALVALAAPANFPVAVPLLGLWLFSPMMAFLVSRPRRQHEEPLTAPEERTLREIARRTWCFFETFVTPEDNWLPPDNYQEDPPTGVAHRTSPTNMGMMLLSTLAAHDLGYLSLTELSRRIGATLDTLDRLERYQGHFFNWYDTHTLKPLPPGYVSTVDSGNLLASLLTLAHGMLDKVDAPVPAPEAVSGLTDTLGLAAAELDAVRHQNLSRMPEWTRAEELMGEMNSLLSAPPGDLAEWSNRLAELNEKHARLTESVRRLEGEPAALAPGENASRSQAPLPPRADTRGAPSSLPPGANAPCSRWRSPKLADWVAGLGEQVKQLREELAGLAPWLEILPGADAGGKDWPELRRRLVAPASLSAWVKALPDLLAALDEPSASHRPEAQAKEARSFACASGLWGKLTAAKELRAALQRSQVPVWAEALRRLAGRAERLGEAMDFRFLYNPQRNLFSIGLNVSAGRLDLGHYDLLASEACLSSFLAIARGEVPRRHWFQLGRLSTRLAGQPGLISWGGTMFEYLMPRLLLPIPRGTLLDSAERTAIDRQIEYGSETYLPWGVSESAFAALGPTQDYQYQSFGAPGLGLKRGLGVDRVVAPYATLLAVPLAPQAALANLERLRAEGGEGAFGFYEAIDYTPDRLPDGERHQVVRCWMAHHQGMAMVALANRLTGELMPRRFRQEPAVRAAELLLQERIPHDAPIVQAETAEEAGRTYAPTAYPVSRRLTSPDTPGPRTHLLSNGRYTVLLTNSGAGLSERADNALPDAHVRAIDVTRWRADRTADDSGQFIYIRDTESGQFWSAGYQPARRQPHIYEVVYSLDKAEIRRVDDRIETLMELAVAPDRDVEVRRVTLRNLGTVRRELEVTSYVEVVLMSHGADLAHPAFGKLFLETEWLPEAQALLCRRRPRARDQQPIWAVHGVAADMVVGEVEHETDRGRFLGRRRSCAAPAGLTEPLSGTVGSVLDPVLVLRRRVRIEPGEAAIVAFSTGVADTHEQAVAMADTFNNLHAVTRTFELAWAHSRLELRHHGLEVEQAHLYQRLGGHIVFPGPALRAPAKVLKANTQGAPGLWRYGISGDLPIVLVRLSDGAAMSLWHDTLAGHAYLRARGLRFDLVALIEEMSGYHEEVFQQAQTVVRASDSRHLADQPGGVFVCKGSHMPEEDRVLLLTAARVVLAGDQGSLGTQIDVRERGPALPPRRIWPTPMRPVTPVGQAFWPDAAKSQARRPDLRFFNGTGGFSADGREYVLAAGVVPPAPWVNVIANALCGFLVSDSGAGCTWVGNSQANRLTPWSNDPATDPTGEAIYLRDETTGSVWSPTPQPAGAEAATHVRHGAGYSIFEQEHDGLEQQLTLFVPTEDPVKVILLRIKNTGAKARRLSATFYAEWVLGTTREQSALFIVSEHDHDSGAILARNAFNPDSGSAVAFAGIGGNVTSSYTADRSEFRGRNRPPSAPAGLEQVRLSGRSGAGLDPCAALQTPLELRPGEEKELVFLLGQSGDTASAKALMARYGDPERAHSALRDVVEYWDRLLGTVQVQTPDEALDLMLNRWLLYQATACRLLGRSAFYQSSGAYGFRDQLQDVLALVHAAPQLAREHLLRAARHQFREGDVLHWWHPPGPFRNQREPGRGVRTRFSDDFLWLPLAACHYAAVTGDKAVFDEQAPFLQAALLGPEDEELYGQPLLSSESGTLYEHCCRALDNGWKLGAHGLPLMGTGDWNDGMNKVGAKGKGESVWDAWFQVFILRAFAEVAEARRDEARAQQCRERAKLLLEAVEEHAWDGGWYLRAFFDDGTPLGSHINDECQIDSLTQTWAVLCGSADAVRADQAVRWAEDRLVKREERLILLFDPPFDNGPLQPGYIKGYVPGIRENGGQYTHAATWMVEAVARLDRGSDAHALFDLLNPIRLATSPEGVAHYRVEPYVLAGDVYGRPPHTGRGGWTWYTGSAAWLYRVGVETLLGLHRRGDRLHIDPRIPGGWKEYRMVYRYQSSLYRITVVNPHGMESGVVRVEMDGVEQGGGEIVLEDDGKEHQVRVEMGTGEP